MSSIVHLIEEIARLKASLFLKNFSIVMCGTAIAQIIGIALTPIISRLFEPEDFGVFGSFTSVLGIVAAGVTLQYTQALMLPKDDDDAANLFAVSIISIVVISMLAFLTAYIFSGWVLEILKAQESKWILWFLPIGIFVSGINQSLQAWCVRKKAFKITASSQMLRSGCINGLQIILGLFKVGSGGLITSAVVADLFASNYLVRQVFKDKILLKKSIKLKLIFFIAKKYRDFPIYSSTQNVMNAFSQGIPVLLLAHFYGIAVAGAYSFSVRILHAPMTFVLTALRQVLFQKASETFNCGERLLPLFVKVTSGLFVLSLFPSIIMFIWAPEIFIWVFGEEWHTAGLYASWLVLWLVPAFANIPSVLIARILRMQRFLFMVEILIFSSRITILIVGGYYFSALNTVILYSSLGFFLNTMLIVWIFGLLFKNEKIKFKRNILVEK